MAWEQHRGHCPRRIFYYGRPEDILQKYLYIIGLGTAPVYYGMRILHYGRPQKFFAFLAWEQHQFIMGGGFFIMGGTQNLLQNHFGFLAWEQHQFIMGEGYFIMGGLKKILQKDFTFLAWEQHQFIMGGGFFIMGGLKNSSEGLYIFRLGTAPVYYGRRIFYYGRPQGFFTITLEFWPGNSTSLLWEEDFLLWEASKIPHNHFGFLAWKQHQFIMGGGFFIMGGLKYSSEGLYIFGLGTTPVYYGRRIFYYGRHSKPSSQSLWIFGLGTAPVYYGIRIFYYGRPQKFFTITLDFWPGNSTSLLWEEDFLLWEASKILQKDFTFLAWEQHQFIMGGGFFIMGGLKTILNNHFGHFWPGNSTSLLWEEDFLLWLGLKNS